MVVSCDGQHFPPAGVHGGHAAPPAETYHIQFETDVTTAPETFEPDAYEFHGPMNRTLRPEGWDRNPELAMDGAVVFLEGLSAAAKELLRPGRAWDVALVLSCVSFLVVGAFGLFTAIF